jgi:hypothetical protein
VIERAAKRFFNRQLDDNRPDVIHFEVTSDERLLRKQGRITTERELP